MCGPIAALQGTGVGRGRGGWTRPSAGRASRGYRSTDDLSYLREFEHVTLARLLLRGRTARDHPSRQWDSWSASEAAEEGGRAGSVDRDPGAAGARPSHARRPRRPRSAPLERALALAEPEGYVRIFVDEGPAMAALLRRGDEAARDVADYVRRLLAAFGEDDPSTPVQHVPWSSR